jgi:hypothetical protein
LGIGGLDSARAEHIKWIEKKLRSRDEVVVRIIESAKVDAPLEDSRKLAKPDPDDQKEYVRQMAKRFGWTINENE